MLGECRDDVSPFIYGVYHYVNSRVIITVIRMEYTRYNLISYAFLVVMMSLRLNTTTSLLPSFLAPKDAIYAMKGLCQIINRNLHINGTQKHYESRSKCGDRCCLFILILHCHSQSHRIIPNNILLSIAFTIFRDIRLRIIMGGTCGDDPHGITRKQDASNRGRRSVWFGNNQHSSLFGQSVSATGLLLSFAFTSCTWRRHAFTVFLA